MERYPTKYTDPFGSETTFIDNDGVALSVPLRGIVFVGRDFDTLEPPNGASPDELKTFTLNLGCLCSCRMECQIPVPVYDHGNLIDGALLVELLLGNPDSNGGIDREELNIVLEYSGMRFSGSGKSGWFEDELIEIQAQLPEGVFFKACINCLYSDYSPYGHGLFGCMMCFRNLKVEYLKVTTKKEFWTVHDRPDRTVQETFLCPEFERRIPGTGYRG